MPDQLKKYIDPAKTRWENLSRPQQYKLVGVIVAVILALALTLFLVFRTSYVYIARNRDFLEISRMMAALDQEGIHFRDRQHGSALQVDERRRLDAMRAIELAGAAPPAERFTWEDALATGLGTTETERLVRNQRALEGQIENFLEASDGITMARVNLSIPPSRPFDQNAPVPSAAVSLTTTRSIPAHEGRNHAETVARSVPGLDIENITIIDQSGIAVFSGTEDIHNDPASAAQDARSRHRASTEMNITRQLSLLFNEVVPSINFVYDDALFREEIVETFSAPDGFEGGIPGEEEVRRNQLEGTPGMWEPGLGANDMAIGGYAMPMGGTMTADQRESIIRYNVNRAQTITQSGPGWIIPELSTGSVSTVFWTDVHQYLWMGEDEERTQADWERFKVENAHPVPINSEFDGFEEILALTASAAGIPIENVTLVIHRRFNFVDIEPTALDIPLFVMIGVLTLLLLMLLYGLVRRQKQAADEEEGMEPELSVEDLLVSTQLEEAKEEAAEELEAIDYFKENEIKKHIEKFVNEKPEAVAALLRNWINVEEW